MTNETLHTLETRRSCRAYKPEQITKEEREAVLRAGTFAPSAMNRQSAKSHHRLHIQPDTAYTVHGYNYGFSAVLPHYPSRAL